MDDMTVEEEWLESIVARSTKKHHERGLRLFTKFLNKSPREVLGLRKQEGKRFVTRLVMFYKWLQKEKDLSSNSARSMIISIQSFLNYFDLPIKVSHKLPKLHMKVETYRALSRRLTETLQIFRSTH